MTITTRLFTFFHGIQVGQDQFGNRYFTEKKTKAGNRSKRWVVYNGKAEPSKVPAEWHGWLHYTFDAPPSKRALAQYDWELPPIPNLTGTKGAYLPPGHVTAGGNRASSTSDYQAWNPNT